jgi:hypothetical protein
MGWYGNEQVAQNLFHELKSRGLARDSEDTKSIPMHYMVRGLILVMLSQILRPHGAKLGADLSAFHRLLTGSRQLCRDRDSHLHRGD